MSTIKTVAIQLLLYVNVKRCDTAASCCCCCFLLLLPAAAAGGGGYG